MNEFQFSGSILNQIDVAVALYNERGTLTYSNTSFKNLNGQLKESLSLPSSSEILKLISKSEKTIFLEINRREFFDQYGLPQGILVTWTDISTLKNTEEELRQSEVFLNSVVDNIPDMIFVKDAKELRFVRFNKAGENLLGYKKTDLMGKNDYDFFPESEAKAFIEKDRAVLAGKAVIEIHEETISTHHGMRVLRTKKIPIWDGDAEPKYLLGISEDVTWIKEAGEQKSKLIREQNARAQAEAYNDTLEKERELRDQFVATITHDLRGPLTSIRASADLLRRFPDKIESTERFTTRIISSIDRADKMIQNLLDANLIRAGKKLSFEITYCRLNSIVEDLLDELAMVHGDRFVCASTQEVNGYWNQSAIQRMIENLACNGIKYGSPDHPVTLSFKADLNSPIATITVHNEGNPIPIEDQTRLFAPFHRTKAAVFSGKKGWGLGLVLTRGLAESLGGSIRVQSSLEKGTSFVIELPLDSRTTF